MLQLQDGVHKPHKSIQERYQRNWWPRQMLSNVRNFLYKLVIKKYNLSLSFSKQQSTYLFFRFLASLLTHQHTTILQLKDGVHKPHQSLQKRHKRHWWPRQMLSNVRKIPMFFQTCHFIFQKKKKKQLFFRPAALLLIHQLCCFAALTLRKIPPVPLTTSPPAAPKELPTQI